MKPLCVDGAQRPYNQGGFLPNSASCITAIFLLIDRDAFSWRTGNDGNPCNSEAVNARCVPVPQFNGLLLDSSFHDRPIPGAQAKTLCFISVLSERIGFKIALLVKMHEVWLDM